MDQYIDLIYKELTGQLTSKEAGQLETWKSSSVENKETYEAVVLAWKMSEEPTPLKRTIDLDDAYQKVHSKINLNPKPEKSFQLYWRVGAAAAILLAVGAFFFLRNYIAPDDLIQYQVKAEKQEYVFPDKSKVVATRGTIISYNKDFGKSNRTIQFEGEAYFAIYEDKKLPFIINSPQLINTVVGTSFLLNDTKDQATAKVQLLEGQLEVQTTSDSKILKSGDLLEFDKNTQKTFITRKAISIDPILKNEVLNIDSRSMTQVALLLESIFEEPIEVSEDIQNCLFSGQLPTEDLANILDVLASVFGATIAQTDLGYQMRGGACN